MSVFSTQTVKCPACGAPVEFELVISVDADARPDLREAILDGSFQRRACPACGVRFRVEPAFTYIDVGRGQYIGVWPVAMREQWQAYAERTRVAYEEAFGGVAPASGEALGAALEPRVVFGWPALAEKIVARDAGIDDRTLELVKVAVLRQGYETFVPGRREMRVVGIDESHLVLGWVDPADGTIVEPMRVLRALVDEIEGDPEAWQALRDSVSEGLVVDFQREMLLP